MIRLVAVGILSVTLGLSGCGASTIDASDREAAKAQELGSPTPTVLVDQQTYGSIETVVGTGNAGFNGDGIDPVETELSSPRGNVADSSGRTLYFADSGNHRVRALSITQDNYTLGDDLPEGVKPVVTTVAGNGKQCRRAMSRTDRCGDGGKAIQATLNSPSDLALSPDERYLFVADTGSNLIRRVDLTNGTITTVAGTGELGYSGDGGLARSAQLAGPQGVVADGDGVYIADTLNNRVRKIDAAGKIETIAGGENSCRTPSDGCGDGGAAVAAQLTAPTGLSIASAETSRPGLLIADGGNHRIRLVSADGVISSVAGDGYASADAGGKKGRSQRLDTPGDVLATGRNGYLIVDSGNSTMRAAWAFSGRTRELIQNVAYTVVGDGQPGFRGDGGNASDARLRQPTAITVIGSTVWISDTDNHRIRRASKPNGSEQFVINSADECRGLSKGDKANTVAVIPILPGASGIEAQGYGAAGGVTIAPTGVIGQYGGPGGYARYGANPPDDTVLAFVGCRGGHGPSWDNYGGGGGGGSTAILTSAGYDNTDRRGLLVVAGGGSGAAYIGNRVIDGSAGANGGGGAGAGDYPGALGIGGKNPDYPQYSGQDGFGGNGGQGHHPDAIGGEGFGWPGPAGNGGPGISGGGAGWGGGAGLMGYEGRSPTTKRASAGSGGGSYSSCGDTSTGALRGSYEHGSVVVTISGAPVKCHIKSR